MSLISVSDKFVVTAYEGILDVYDFKFHNKVCDAFTKDEDIIDLRISSDSSVLAIATCKRVIRYKLPITSSPESCWLPRRISKVKFSVDDKSIFAADKTGDVWAYEVEKIDKPGTKIMGCLSLLLDVLQSHDKRFLITCDRDEKIRVLCYPNTYIIHTFCLGHKEFVNNIELLPHNKKYLISTSGDGTVMIWDYVNGKNCGTIDVNSDISDAENKAKVFQEFGDVDVLPVIHLTTTQLDEKTSLIGVTLYSQNEVFVYSIKINDSGTAEYKLETKLQLELFPTSIQFLLSELFIFYESQLTFKMYNMLKKDGTLSFEFDDSERILGELDLPSKSDDALKHFENVKLLYKRKIDNVEEYLNRKKQRMSGQPSVST